jgi:hypothetical protein
MKTFFCIVTFFITVSCAAQSTLEGVTFHVTPPDTAWLAKMQEEQNKRIKDTTNYHEIFTSKSVKSGRAKALAKVMAKYTVKEIYGNRYKDRDAAETIYFVNNFKDSTFKIEIYQSDTSPEPEFKYLYVNTKGFESSRAIPLKLITQFLE